VRVFIGMSMRACCERHICTRVIRKKKRHSENEKVIPVAYIGLGPKDTLVSSSSSHPILNLFGAFLSSKEMCI
jgi:hypothetical protein